MIDPNIQILAEAIDGADWVGTGSVKEGRKDKDRAVAALVALRDELFELRANRLAETRRSMTVHHEH